MAQSHQQSYEDVRRSDLEFEVDDRIYLKVTPMKDVMKFSEKWKYRPWYVGPYRISNKIGNIAYQLE